MHVSGAGASPALAQVKALQSQYNSKAASGHDESAPHSHNNKIGEVTQSSGKDGYTISAYA